MQFVFYYSSTPIKCGSTLRLQHLQTRLFLHSHLFASPLSGNQEVSCYGDGATGDHGKELDRNGNRPWV